MNQHLQAFKVHVKTQVKLNPFPLVLSKSVIYFSVGCSSHGARWIWGCQSKADW